MRLLPLLLLLIIGITPLKTYTQSQVLFSGGGQWNNSNIPAAYGGSKKMQLTNTNEHTGQGIFLQPIFIGEDFNCGYKVKLGQEGEDPGLCIFIRAGQNTLNGTDPERYLFDSNNGNLKSITLEIDLTADPNSKDEDSQNGPHLAAFINDCISSPTESMPLNGSIDPDKYYDLIINWDADTSRFDVYLRDDLTELAHLNYSLTDTLEFFKTNKDSIYLGFIASKAANSNTTEQSVIFTSSLYCIRPSDLRKIEDYFAVLGDATYQDDTILCGPYDHIVRLTSIDQAQGGMQYKSNVDLREGFDFSFCYSTSESQGNGVLAVFQSEKQFWSSSYGAGFGYNGRVASSIAFELDTHPDPNQFGDGSSTEDHFSLMINGQMENPIIGPIPADINPNIPIESSNEIRIIWDPVIEYFQVYFNNKLKLNKQINLIDSVFRGDPIVYLAVLSSRDTSVMDEQVIALGNQSETNCCPQEVNCVANLSPSIWLQTGPPSNSCWAFVESGDSITQQDHTGPSFIISGQKYINTKLRGKVRLENTADEGFWGFLIGHRGPIGHPWQTEDFFLFDIHQKENGNSPYFFSDIINSVDLNCTRPECIALWRHEQSSLGFNTRINEEFPTLPTHTDLPFILTYSESQLIIEINGDTLVQIDSCFEAGRFGFFTNEQSGVTFFDLSYEKTYDFELVDQSIYCQGTVVDLFIPYCNLDQTIQDIATVEWNFGDGMTQSSSVESIIDLEVSHIFDSIGVFDIELLIIDQYGCRQSIQERIEITPFFPTLIADTIRQCYGLPYHFDFQSSNFSSISFEWSDGSQTAKKTFSANGDYWVEITSDQCIRRDSFHLIIYPDFQLDNRRIEADCGGQEGGSINLEMAGGNSDFNFQLSNSTLNLSNQEGRFAKLKMGDYEIRITDSNDCDKSWPVKIPEGEVPDYSLDFIDPNCFGYANGIIQAEGVNSGARFSLNNINYFDILNIRDASAGNYQIWIQDSVGCTYQDSVALFDPPPIYLQVTPDDTIALGETKQLKAFTSFKSIVDYYWSDQNQILCSGCREIAVQPNTTNTYFFTLENDKGCQLSLSSKVTVKDATEVFIPNIFTPNGDGVNDKFRPYCANPNSILEHFTIHQRGGAMVFEIREVLINEIGLGWDGRYKGVRLPSGVYVYQIKIRFPNNKVYLFQGDITLVK